MSWADQIWRDIKCTPWGGGIIWIKRIWLIHWLKQCFWKISVTQLNTKKGKNNEILKQVISDRFHTNKYIENAIYTSYKLRWMKPCLRVGKSHQEREAAMCFSLNKSNILKIPGKYECKTHGFPFKGVTCKDFNSHLMLWRKNLREIPLLFFENICLLSRLVVISVSLDYLFVFLNSSF